MPLNRNQDFMFEDTTTLTTNAKSLKGALNEVNASLAENTSKILDLSVNVRDYKTSSNNWNQALQSAINYAGTLYSSQSEVIGLTVPQNVVVKMPRGVYTIDTPLIGVTGLDFDFSGCTFVASPNNKTINFIDMTGHVFRNRYHKGVFAGFNTVLLFTTNNADTSNFVWDSPTFQACSVGIDTVSYASSRSTYIQINNIYSLQTDCAIKTHSDMCQINGGWLYHNGYNGAVIYNQGFTKITNVIGVPLTPQSGARPRWIDNYSEDAGSTSILGERGIVVDHCRFGGENGGGYPLIFNYATNTITQSSYKPTIIDVKNSYTACVGTTDVSLIVLFALPNKISLKNLSGLTNVTNGLIHADSSFNTTTVAYSKYINIDLDSSAYNNYKLMDSDLTRFYKTFENSHTKFRPTFFDGKVGYYTATDATGAGAGKTKVTIPISTPVGGSQTDQINLGAMFLCAIHTSLSGSSYAYKEAGLYIIAVTGGNNGSTVKRLNITQLADYKGGASFLDDIGTVTPIWGSGDTGSADIAYNSTETNVTLVFNGVSALTRVSILPLWGQLAITE